MTNSSPTTGGGSILQKLASVGGWSGGSRAMPSFFRSNKTFTADNWNSANISKICLISHENNPRHKNRIFFQKIFLLTGVPYFSFLLMVLVIIRKRCSYTITFLKVNYFRRTPKFAAAFLIIFHRKTWFDN